MTDSGVAGARRVIVITGGGSGIGLAVAGMCLQRSPDDKIVVLDKDIHAIDDLATGSASDQLLALTADVSDPQAVDGSFARAREWAGHGVTHLVAAAGNFLKVPSIDMTPPEWHSILGVHLDGTFFACQAAARQMVMGTGGAIVNVSSVAEAFAWPTRLPYAVSKAGISALTRTLAVEWAEHGIRVNAVAPGFVETPLVQNAIARGALVEDVTVLHALRRLGQPREIASVILFLLSEEASFVTGETVFIDGGFRALKVAW